MQGIPAVGDGVVNFMCQVDWTMICPDNWFCVILGVSVTVFLVILVF